MKKPKRPELRIERAAQWLQDAHARRERFEALPTELAPRSEEEAYAIQDDFVALRAQQRGAIAGYKIALSTAAMRTFVGLETPLAGAMLEKTLLRSPGTVRAADYVDLIVEFEIAVEVAEDLPAADAPFARERIAQATGAIMPALELADDRGADYAQLVRQPLDLICDNAWNEGAVLGAPVKEWQGIDLGEVLGTASINGREVGEGRGREALGHPLDAVAWVANHLASSGRGLLRGDIVITGSLVTTKKVSAGDRVRFVVEGLGEVQLSVE